MTAPIPYDYDLYWQQLEHGHADWPANQAMPGFYRKRERNGTLVGVAIWMNGSDRPVVKIGHSSNETLTAPSREIEFCEGVFAWIAKSTVTEESYRSWLTTGVWHDDVPAANVNHNAAPHVVAKETIEDIKRQAEAWLAEIGGEVKTQEQADKAANFADRFGEISKESEAKRKAEKDPVLKQGKEIDGRWNAVTDAGDAAKVWALALVKPFLQAEQARKLAAAAEKAAAGEVVREVDTKVKAGTRGRSTSLRTTQKAKVENYAAAFAHYRDTPRFRDLDLVKTAIDQLATADLKAGHEVPGAKLIDVQTAHS